MPKTNPSPPAGPTAAPNAALAPALRYVPLSALRFGHEHPTKNINARVYGRDDVADLVPTVRSFGVLVPLVVLSEDKVSYAVEGNRRLKALHEIFPPQEQTAVMVPTIEAGQGDPLEISMLVNSQRRDLHPVDQYEVFQVLIEAGAGVDDIAAKYLMKVPQVRQALALARLAPEVRDAWRKDEIDGAAAEAFALTTDHKAQATTLARLGKRKDLSAWQVEREFKGDRVNVGTLLKFVGRPAYEKAGHFVNETLFGERGDGLTVSDLGALKAMAGNRLAAECAALIADGWGWAITNDKAPSDLYAWKRVYPGAGGKFTADVKKAAGCVVDIAHNGQLQVTRGYVKPGSKIALPKGAGTTPEQRKAQDKRKKARAEGDAPVTNALAIRLSQQMTLAAADVLADEPMLSLCVAIAALACGSSPTNIALKSEDYMRREEWRELDAREENEFDKYLRLVLSKRQPDQLGLLAHWVAQGVDVTCHHADHLPLTEAKSKHGDGSALALLKAMPAGKINNALRKHFKAEDYFASMAADAARSALKEMGLMVPGGGKKADLAKAAAIGAVDKKWLPPEMRIPGAYDGPAAKAAKPAAAKKAAKPGKAKRK